MVEFSTVLQFIQATGILIGVAYYVLTLRSNSQIRKIELSTNISQRLGTKEKLKDFIDLADLKWESVEAFREKYDSSINPESYTKRWALWIEYDTLGYLLRKGMIDREILFNSQGNEATVMWARYKPVIDDIRSKEMGVRWMENFQYLAEEMWDMAKTHEYVSSNYRGGLVFDAFRDIYESTKNPP